MVTITFEKGGGKFPLCLTATGHALYNPHGDDVVCAAVSVLLHTAAKTAEEWEEQGSLEEPATITLSPGNGQVRFVPKPKYYFQALTQIETVVRGLELLSAYYPNYVSFIKK